MLKNAKIAVRLAVGFGLVIVLLLIMGLISRIKMGSLADMTTLLYNHPFTVSTKLLGAEIDIARMQRDLCEAMLTDDAPVVDLAVTGIEEARKSAHARLEIVRKFYLGDQKDVDAIFATLEAWKPSRDKIIQLLQAGKKQEAVNLYQKSGALHIAQLDEKLAVIENFAANKAAFFIRDAKDSAQSAYIFIYLLIVSAVALSLAIAILASRSIARPLNEAVAIANRIAVGDLNITLPKSSGSDEVGELLQAFGRMIHYLQETAAIAEQIAARNLAIEVSPLSADDDLGNAFKTMIDNLRKIIANVQDSTGVVASSVGEILSTTTQLATGIAETATSVTETTATVEEVRQTALLAAEKSANVSEIAKKAAAVAEQGDTAVAETMDDISNIKELMNTVAESVVLLAEQSQTIGDIITAVNDLAQQSNLLAVNAAIEASKAGEQGKGFTVVALEIKSLADQSKQATEQVRSILSDIQKATGRSVLAAEQVSKAVDSSVRQAAESGDSIRMLAENIYEAAQAAAQIAASSQQQLAGMEQVAMAMESIKQASQQNVSGTKQAELAAHTLNDLGKNLNELIGTYKV